MTVRGRLLKHSMPVPESGCWIWTASLGTAGYGQLTVLTTKGRRPNLAHRLSYEVFKGPIGDKFVLHRCDVKTCINPDHLFLGSHQENMDDKVAKGRQRTGAGIPSSALTDEEVYEIRANTEGLSQYALAEKYGITQSNVSYIQAGKTWKHLLDQSL